MKDNDLREQIFLHPDDRMKLLLHLERDTDFLKRNNIMDYSLLVGIEKGTSPFHNVHDQDCGSTENRSCSRYC